MITAVMNNGKLFCGVWAYQPGPIYMGRGNCFVRNLNTWIRVGIMYKKC